MTYMIGGIATYVVLGFVVCARLAVVVGKHRGMHVRKEQGPRDEHDCLKYCPSVHCDRDWLFGLYLVALLLPPVFLLVSAVMSFLDVFRRYGFNSVQLPENSHPGIEITEVRLKKKSNELFVTLAIIVLILATIYVGGLIYPRPH